VNAGRPTSVDLRRYASASALIAKLIAAMTTPAPTNVVNRG